MKSSTKYRIFLFLCMMVVLLILFSAYQLKIGRQEKIKTKEKVLTEKQEEPGYVLKIEDGRIVIYEDKGNQLFDVTNIKSSELPAEIREKIKKGYYLRNLKELFDFLENYSS